MHLLTCAAGITLLLLASGCGRQDQQQESPGSGAEIQKQVLDALQPYIDNPEKSIDELKKLRQIEYEVFVVPASPDKLAGKLRELGRDNWDCFHIERLQGGGAHSAEDATLMVICKRGAQTMLRYLPRSLL